MKYIWVDPPEGWKYGFPKLMPEDTKDTIKWLRENGYPKDKEIYWTRYWEPTQEEINENL